MVPPYSLWISRVPRYSGYRLPIFVFAYKTLTSSGAASHPLRLTSIVRVSVRTPCVFLLTVWPLSLSLATTHEISVDFSSSAYLDVSVRRVPLIYLFDSAYHSRFFTVRVSPFGYPRIDAYLQLPVAFRS